MKKIILLVLHFPFLLNAQILDQFPRGQNFYEGGITKLFSDIHQIIDNNKIEKCSDPKELYRLNLLLTKEGDIKFIKDFDTVNIKKNQCAYDLSKNLAINLKNKTWIPAEVKGQKFSSLIYLMIFPDDLFEKYRADYSPSKFFKGATFKDGEKNLTKVVRDNFERLFLDYNIRGTFYLNFYVDSDGEIVSPSVQPEIENRDFKRDFFRTLQGLNQKWIPATFHGISIKTKLSVPLTFVQE